MMTKLLGPSTVIGQIWVPTLVLYSLDLTSLNLSRGSDLSVDKSRLSQLQVTENTGINDLSKEREFIGTYNWYMLGQD